MQQPAAQASDLADAVAYLAAASQDMRDADLGQPYTWGAYKEGIRFALLVVMLELRALAVHLAAERRHAGPPFTRAQHALAQYHAAYRDLDPVLLGATDEEYNKPPAPGEWPLRFVYGHMVGVERNFFALIDYGLRRWREGGDMPPELPDGEANRLLGSFEDFNAIMETGTQAEMAAYHAVQHDRALAEFAGIGDADIDAMSYFWEGEPFSLEYRLHRFDAHLRQHIVQVEKTRDQLGRPAGEAHRLLRQVYAALAEVEGTLIGAPELGAVERAAAAVAIRRTADDITAALGRAHVMIAAVTGGDRERVADLLAEDGEVANTTSRDGVPLARLAVYYGQKTIAETLADTPGVELEIWDAAALGRLAPVKKAHEGWGDFIINDYSRDGYTPLQLACFFGRDEVARYLVEKGADVSAVSQNPMAIQPLHAAAAGSHTAIVRLLLEAGADPNAAQQDSFRPLHSAAQNGNAAVVRLLLEHGADPTLTDGQGRLPRALADEAGHTEVVGILS